MFHNVKIVGNWDIPPPYVTLMDQSVSNAMVLIIVLIKLNIIGILLGTTKQILK